MKQSKKQKNTVVVTGGAGFLGSHLVPALIKKGFKVYVIDNLVAGKKENVPDKANFIKLDIRNREELIKTFKAIAKANSGILGVFHLAALPRVQFSIDHPKEAHSVNVDGLINVLDASVEAHVSRLVYSASSSAYGDQKTLPLHERLVPNPMSPYAVHKYLGELLARNYSMHYGLPTVSLRYFNIYGPNADPNGPYAQAIIKFIFQKKNGEAITVTGDGKQTRDSVHASDVVRANIMALESKKVGKGEVINIGSGKSSNIIGIARLIGGDIKHVAPRVEPKHTRADIKLAKKLLGWSPEIKLEDGIKELKRLHKIN